MYPRYCFAAALCVALLLSVSAPQAQPASGFSASWEALGEGITAGTSVAKDVRALAFGSDGRLYVTGAFTAVDGVPTGAAARWDGDGWTPLGKPSLGFSSGEAVAVTASGQLFVGGGLLYYGPDLALHISRWDGEAWRGLQGLYTGTSERVNVLARGPNGTLYAGGQFTHVGNPGNLLVNRVARWDGASWSALGSGLTGATSQVHALAVGPDGALYVGGIFEQAGGVEASNVARWDGQAWSALGAGTDGAVMALAFSSDGILYAGGGFSEAGGIPANRVARWTGATWEPLGNGVTGFVQALAVDADGTVYVGGLGTRQNLEGAA